MLELYLSPSAWLGLGTNNTWLGSGEDPVCTKTASKSFVVFVT